jgi:hypothetical protein
MSEGFDIVNLHPLGGCGIVKIKVVSIPINITASVLNKRGGCIIILVDTIRQQGAVMIVIYV